jgi:hypothetical protein
MQRFRVVERKTSSSRVGRYLTLSTQARSRFKKKEASDNLKEFGALAEMTFC